jgi:hypothetical protein
MHITGPRPFLTLSLTLAAIAGFQPLSGADSITGRRVGDPSPRASGPIVHTDAYDINDLRLTVGFLPRATGDGEDWSSNNRIAVTGMRANPLGPYGGLIYGGEFSINFASVTENSVKTSETSELVEAMVGWGYKLAEIPALHFEGTPFFGVGLAEWSQTNNGDPIAFAYEYGLRAAGYYTFTNLWQAGLDLRYVSHHSNPSFNSDSVNFDNDGIAILFSGGKRF